MRRGRELRIDAYRDRALSPSERAQVERALESDPDCAARLEQTDALGRAVRAAWTDGPDPPQVEYLIAALRPELARADAELASQRSVGERLRDAIRPVPSVAFAGAVALLLLLVWPTLTEVDGLSGAGSPAGTQLAQGIDADALAEPAAPLAALESPAAIYDLAQGESPLMIFEGLDGSTVIWILEEEDDLSFMTVAAEGWA